MKEIKIKTPYGNKNWSFVKRCFDSHNNLLEACELALNILYDNMEDMEEKNGKIHQTIECGKFLHRVINKAKEE